MILREERIGNQRLILGDCLAVMPTLAKLARYAKIAGQWK